MVMMRQGRRMPDIFLSYSRKDLAVAGQLAAALQAAGHDVWWDQALKSGEVYDRVTEAALREARVVVVLWSKASVASDWVRSEATVALQRNALMPVMIEDCQRPVMFELRQSADLIGWKGNAKDPRLVAFVGDVARQLGAPQPVPKPAAIVPGTPGGPSRRLLIGGAAGVAALAAGGLGAWQLMGNSEDKGSASIAVLPFANLSGDPAQAYFSDGIAEELRNALAQISGLKVIGRVSSEQFRDATDLAAVAEKLGVVHILTGSVRRSPATIRIGAELVDGKTGAQSWSQSYDQPAGDVLAVQSRIASSVVTALSARLGAMAGIVAVGGTSNPKAQELFLQAKALGAARPSEATLRQQIALLDQAIALDPRYAEAFAAKSRLLVGLATSYTYGQADITAIFAQALATARQAVALAPGFGFAHAALAEGFRSILDIRNAHAEVQRAFALAPGDGRVVSAFARMLTPVDPDRAVGIAERALALDPLDQRVTAARAGALFAARRYQDAATLARRMMQESDKRRGATLLINTLLAMGQPDTARQLVTFMPKGWQQLVLLALVEARAGNRAAADAALAAFRRLDDGTFHYQFATLHAQRGEIPAALDAIENALKTKDPGLNDIAVNPFLDPLRKEPRFKAVQDKIIPPDLFVPARLAPVA